MFLVGCIRVAKLVYVAIEEELTFRRDLFDRCIVKLFNFLDEFSALAGNQEASLSVVEGNVAK
jgi:hypothetical protein